MPPFFGGLPDAKWWEEHHAHVPYVMVRCEADRIVMPQSVVMLRDTAPHGSLELFDGAEHDFLLDPKWETWLAKTVGFVKGLMAQAT